MKAQLLSLQTRWEVDALTTNEVNVSGIRNKSHKDSGQSVRISSSELHLPVLESVLHLEDYKSSSLPKVFPDCIFSS